MKLKYYLWLCIAIVIVVLYSCVRAGTDDKAVQNVQTDLTVDEAQAFFENQISTRAIAPNGHNVLPGEFTPHWKKAVPRQRNNIASVDVGIDPQYRYRAIRSEFKNGRAKAYAVGISQKLVIVKDTKTGVLAQYVLTLIPDQGYYSKNKGDISNHFINNGDKAGYNGLAIWLYEGIPVRVDRYQQGTKVGGITVLGLADKKLIADRIVKILHQLKTIQFIRIQSLATRSGGEDWDYENGDHVYHEIGWGYFFDDDGNLYYDTDGDDKPDSIYIPPVDIPSVPDPEPEISEDNFCPFCGGDPCCCDDDLYFPDDDEDYPYIDGGDDDQIVPPMDVQDLLDKLNNNRSVKKLMEKVKLDRIKITPPPPGKEQQKGVTHKDGSIEIHDTSPIVLLEELMHRFQKENDIWTIQGER